MNLLKVTPTVDARLVIAVLEESVELLEVVSSEIPIQSQKRQTIEPGIRRIRALISLCREEVARVQKEASPEQGNAQ